MTQTSIKRNWSYQVLQEKTIEFLLFCCGCLSVLVTCAIIIILLKDALPFFQSVGLWSFLTDTQWTPLFENPHFGISSLLSATFVTSFIAICLSVPVGTIIAVYLSEFVRGSAKTFIKYALELLGSIPTIVYGLFAFFYLTPFLQYFMPYLPGFNMLSAGLALGMMLIPQVAAFVEEALQSVPMRLRESAYALGATRIHVAWFIVFRAARSGIITAYILAVSRAIGETMIVTIAAGMQPLLTLNPFSSGETATSYIVQVAMGDVPHGSQAYSAIFAVGLTLLLITFLLNACAYFFRKGHAYPL